MADLPKRQFNAYKPGNSNTGRPSTENLFASVTALQPKDYLESAALYGFVEYLIRSGLNETLQTLLLELEKNVANPSVWQPPEADAESVRNAISEATTFRDAVPDTARYKKVLTALIDWASQHTLTQARAPLMEFSFVVFVIFWFKLTSFDQCIAWKDELWPEKTAAELWPHQDHLLIQMFTVDEHTSIHQLPLVRYLLDGYRFTLQMPKHIHEILIFRLLSSHSRLLLDTYTFYITWKECSTSDMFSEVALPCCIAHIDSLSDKQGEDADSKLTAPKSNKAMDCLLPVEIEDTNSLLESVIAPSHPEAPNRMGPAIVDVFDGIIKDRINKNVKEGCERYGVRPRIDMELCEPVISPSTLKRNPYPFIGSNKSSAALIRRRLDIYNSARRAVVDGSHHWPSALNWKISCARQQASWLPGKVAFEPYSGNASLLAMSFDPGPNAGGFIGSQGGSVIRIYDSLAFDVKKVHQKFTNDISGLTDISALDPTHTIEEWPDEEFIPKYDVPLRRIMLDPLQAKNKKLSSIINDELFLNYIKTGRLQPRPGTENTTGQVPLRIRTLIQDIAMEGVQEATGVRPPVSLEPLVETDYTDVTLEAMATPMTNLVTPKLSSEGLTLTDTPWQLEANIHGAVTDIAWLLGNEQAELLGSQYLVSASSKGNCSIYSLPTEWDQSVMLHHVPAAKPKAQPNETFGELEVNDEELPPDIEEVAVEDNDTSSRQNKNLMFMASLAGGNLKIPITSIDCPRPYGGFIGTCDWNGSVQIWNVGNLTQPVRSYKQHASPILTSQFHPNGHLFATAGLDKQIYIYDIRRPSKVATLSGHRDIVNHLRFSPNGGILSSATRSIQTPRSSNNDNLGKGVLLWDLRKYGQCVDELLPDHHVEPNMKIPQIPTQSLYGSGVVMDLTWARGSDVLSIGYSSGIIASVGVGAVSNVLPLPIVDESIPLPGERQILHTLLEPGAIPLGLYYNDVNIMMTATTQL